DRSQPSQFHRDLGRDSGLGKKLIEQTPGVPTALAQDQILSSQRVRTDNFLLGKFVTRRRDGNERVFTQQFSLHSAGLYRQRNEGNVQRTRQDLLHQLLAGA